MIYMFRKGYWFFTICCDDSGNAYGIANLAGKNGRKKLQFDLQFVIPRSSKETFNEAIDRLLINIKT